MDSPDPPGCQIQGAGIALMGAFVVLALMGGIVWGIEQGFIQMPVAGPQGPIGPGEGISARHFPSGTVRASVSGDFAFSSEIEIDPYASETSPNGHTLLAFSDLANPGSGDITIALNEPGNYVIVAQGNAVAMAQDEACDFDIHVTESSVSGSVACASAEVTTDGVPSGTSSINLQFSTTSVPWDFSDGSGDPYDDAPTDTPDETESQ